MTTITINHGGTGRATASPTGALRQAWDPGAPLVLRARRSGPRRAAGVVNGLVTVLLTVLTILTVVLGVLAVAGTRPSLERSDSMAPMLHAGDVVFLTQVSAHEVRGGDVLAFEDPRGTERILVHRVVRAQPVPAPLAQGRYGERRRVELVTRGDANTGTERFRVDADGELGRYAFHLPAVGRPLASLHGVPLGVMVGLSGLALTFMALRRIWGTR